MIHLEIEAAVAECLASLHALRAAYAFVLIHGVFVIWLLDEFPLQGMGGAQLFFRSSVELHRARPEVSETEIAVAADIECMEAFHGGRRDDALGGAPSALDAFRVIDLPDGTFFPCSSENREARSSDCQEDNSGNGLAQGLTPRDGRVSIFSNLIIHIRVL